MFITRKHLSRRTVLRGMGATIALPFLESMLPAMTAAPPKTKTRLVCIENVHGAAGSTKAGIEKNLWAPASEGREFDLSKGNLAPLEPFKDHVTIVSNMDMHGAEAWDAPLPSAQSGTSARGVCRWRVLHLRRSVRHPGRCRICRPFPALEYLHFGC